jgi:hypothetical protein
MLTLSREGRWGLFQPGRVISQAVYLFTYQTNQGFEETITAMQFSFF